MRVFEAFVVVACFLVVAALLLSFPTHQKRPARQVLCIDNLRQVNLAFRIWEEDNSNLYPMAVSVTNGGAMELISAGNLAGCLHVVSDEINTLKILVCPDDTGRRVAPNWNSLNNSNISYFFSADLSNDADRNRVFSGDDNLAIGGKPVASGLVDLSSSAPVSWIGARHEGRGNLAMADGTVSSVRSPTDLRRTFQRAGLATNRIVIP